MKPKALVILSGGQDSTTCLFWAIANGYDVHTITFDYGQRHAVELDAAAIVCGMAGLPVLNSTFLEVGPILQSTSPLVSDNQLEQYSGPDALPGGLEKTFVPMRNQLFITLAANHAYSIGCTVLVTGVCEEDYGGYPDCRNKFIRALENACNLGTFTGEEGALGPLRIETPLMFMSKAASIELATDLKGCYAALAYSHTAYDGHYPPTGRDHASLLRAKGFIQAMVPDPLVLRAVKEGVMDLPLTPNYAMHLVEAYGAFVR